jgi:hypothetical protein
MAESRGGAGARGWSAQLARVGSVFLCGADRVDQGRTGMRSLRPTRGWLVELTTSIRGMRPLSRAGAQGWLGVWVNSLF